MHFSNSNAAGFYQARGKAQDHVVSSPSPSLSESQGPHKAPSLCDKEVGTRGFLFKWTPDTDHLCGTRRKHPESPSPGRQPQEIRIMGNLGVPAKGCPEERGQRERWQRRDRDLSHKNC